MMITEGEQLLAELQGDTARSWQAFADANGVSVGALLDALGPILHDSSKSNLDLRDALQKAIDAAR